MKLQHPTPPLLITGEPQSSVAFSKSILSCLKVSGGYTGVNITSSGIIFVQKIQTFVDSIAAEIMAYIKKFCLEQSMMI